VKLSLAGMRGPAFWPWRHGIPSGLSLLHNVTFFKHRAFVKTWPRCHSTLMNSKDITSAYKIMANMALHIYQQEG
jgi:hypothetical protein